MLFVHPFLHPIAQPERSTPWTRRLKRFRDDVQLHGKIANVCNAECHLIPSLAVLCASLHPSVFSSNPVDYALLPFHILGRAFEHQRSSYHFLSIEMFKLNEVCLFEPT